MLLQVCVCTVQYCVKPRYPEKTTDLDNIVFTVPYLSIHLAQEQYTVHK